MTVIPDTANEFFTQYVPERFTTVKAGVAGKTSAGCLTFRVGDDTWSMRVTSGEARIYPIVTFEAQRSSYIDRLRSDEELADLKFEIVPTDFEFLIGSNFYLSITRS